MRVHVPFHSPHSQSLPSKGTPVPVPGWECAAAESAGGCVWHTFSLLWRQCPGGDCWACSVFKNPEPVSDGRSHVHPSGQEDSCASGPLWSQLRPPNVAVSLLRPGPLSSGPFLSAGGLPPEVELACSLVFLWRGAQTVPWLRLLSAGPAE